MKAARRIYQCIASQPWDDNCHARARVGGIWEAIDSMGVLLNNL
jgi:hypothetical protein